MRGPIIIAIADLMLLLAVPGWADEGPDHLHKLPPTFFPIEPFIGPNPFPGDQRAAFDRALRSMYRKSCDCLMYVKDGVVRKMSLPLDDTDRWRLFGRILKGVVIPLGPHGDES